MALGMDTGYSVYLFELAAAAESVGASLYAYNFLYSPSAELTEEPRVEADWNQPWHGDDIMFVFGTPHLQNLGKINNHNRNWKRISSTFSILRPFSDLRYFLRYFLRYIFSVLRPLYFALSISTSLVRTVYLDSLTSTSVLRPFVKYGFIIGRETQVEVQFWSK